MSSAAWSPSSTAWPAAREAIERAAGGAPYVPLATIDDIYPDRGNPGGTK